MPILGTSADWSRDSDGGFSNRTFERNWHVPEEEIRRGRSFRVRYIGKMQVLASMRSMKFDDRASIAKECISRVCEEAGMTTPSKKRKTERRIQEVLGHIDLESGGEDINLIVNVERIQIISLRGELIASHELPEISFASGGDAETIDFIAYVGKSGAPDFSSRWCFVIECGAGITQDCVATIGQAFDLKFKQYIQRGSSGADRAVTPAATSSAADAGCETRSNSWVRVPVAQQQHPSPANEKRRLPAKLPTDAEYYNDMPGKSAPPNADATVPDVAAPIAPLPVPRARGELKSLQLSSSKPPDSNLIDLNSPAHDRAKKGGEFAEFSSMDPLAESQFEHENSDPFDVAANVHHLLQSNLDSFPWYHGKLSRSNAEHLLKCDGDFLVRISANAGMDISDTEQQYVLSGQHMGVKAHILLVDYDNEPRGVVRTRNHDFASIPHLIDVHFTSSQPLMSSDKEIFLLRPIPKPYNALSSFQ